MWFETYALSSKTLKSTTVEILMWFETRRLMQTMILSTTVEILMWFETFFQTLFQKNLQQ